MGETLKREFQPGQVVTGPQPDPNVVINNATFGGPVPQAQSRPTFLSAYLQNLGPALAGGAGAGGFEAGVGGALRGIEEQKRSREQYGLQQEGLKQRGEIAAANLDAQQARQQALFFQQQLLNAANRGTTERGQDITASTSTGNAKLSADTAAAKLAQDQKNFEANQARLKAGQAENARLREKGIDVGSQFRTQVVGLNVNGTPHKILVDKSTGEQIADLGEGQLATADAQSRGDFKTLSDQFTKLEGLSANNPDAIGPWAGRLGQARAALIGDQPNAADLYATAHDLQNQIIYLRSGKQINEAEYLRLLTALPDPNLPLGTFNVRLKNFKAQMAALYKNRTGKDLKNFGDLANLNNVGNAASDVIPPPPPGFTRIN